MRIFGGGRRGGQAPVVEQRPIFDQAPLTIAEALEFGFYDVSPEAQATGLPIFDPVKTWVANDTEAMRAQAAQGSDFVRGITFELPASLERVPLRDILRLLDRELENVAACCGALVVGHEWGLVNAMSQSIAQRRQSPMTPRGYLLVARVESIPEAQQPTMEQMRRINANLDRYRSAKQAGEVALTDLDARQFMAVPDSEGPAGLRLVDIDGRFA